MNRTQALDNYWIIFEDKKTMPATKQRIGDQMKMEQNPLIYLEYTPTKKLNIAGFFKNSLTNFVKPIDHNLRFQKEQSSMRFCMGYVSRPYEQTYRITTCRHLVSSNGGAIPTKEEILEGLEVFARFEGVNKRFHSLMFEDVDIKVHEDVLADLLFIEITQPDNYNFQLLNQAAARCRRRFPGSQVYYFQNHKDERYFRLFEGAISREKIYITGITNDGSFFIKEDKPTIHHRQFLTIDTTDEVLVTGASGSPLLSRRGEVIGMMCAHDQGIGRGIYLSVEKIERLYDEIQEYHK